MWPFRRRAEPDANASATPAPVMRQDWKGLAPTQRAIGDHPLTAPGPAFAGALATNQDPSVVSRTLGHHVSPEAPAGLLLATAAPSVTRNHGPAMVSAPRLQRRSAPASHASMLAEGDDLESPPDQPVAAHPPDTAPRRELPIAAGEPAPQRLLTVAPETRPVPVDAARPTRAPAGRVGRLDIPISSPASSPDPEGFSPASAEPSPSGPMRLSLGQSRRLGLGPPLRQVAGTPVQRAVAETTDPALARARQEPPPEAAATTSPVFSPAPGLQASIQPGAPSQAIQGAGDRTTPFDLMPRPNVRPADRESAASLRPPAGRQLPTAPSSPARRSATTAAEIAVAPSDSMANPPAGPRGASGQSATSVLAAPVTPAAVLQRVADPAPPGLEPAKPDPGLHHPLLPPAGVRAAGPTLAPLVGSRSIQATASGAVAMHAAQAGRSLGSSGSATRVAATAPPPPAASVIQRLPLTRVEERPAAPPEGQAPSRPERSLLTHGSTPDASPIAPEARAAGGFEASPVDGGGADGPRSLPLAPVPGLAALQRASATPEAAAPAFAQRARFENSADSAPPSGAGGDGPGGMLLPALLTGGIVAQAGPGPDREADMDTLAGKLYDRIRTRLKSELLVDRERAGFLTDLR